MSTVVALGSLLELSDSGVWGGEDETSGVSVLRSTNFNSDGSLDLSKLTFRVLEERNRERKLLRPGDILLEKSGGGRKQPVGRVCLFKGDVRPHSFGNFIARLRPRESVLSEYLFYVLWHYHATGRTSQFQKQTTGIRNLEFKRYLTIDVPVVSLEHQRRIVDLLSRAEGIVRLRREAQRKAAEIIPALFLDMFGDPATNPKGWEEVTLGQVIASADYGSSTKAIDEGPGLPMIRMGNVDYAGNLDLSDLKFVQLPDDEGIRYRLEKGDLLFNRTNSKDLVGKTGLWEGEIEAIAASYFIRVRVDRNKVNPLYVWAFMNTPHMKHVFFETARGAIGQANINAKELRAFRIPVPPIDLQLQFDGRSRRLQAIERQQRAAAVTADATFNALLGRVFLVANGSTATEHKVKVASAWPIT